MIRVQVICRRERSRRGLRGRAVKGPARAAGPVLLAIATAALCLAWPTAASAAQRPAGNALTWGDNYEGQLGTASTTDSYYPVPPDLPAGTHLTAVSAGQQFTLALTSDGSVLAWGDNAFGQLGNGIVGGMSSTPVAVHLPAGTHVTAVSAGYVFSLALTSGGRVLTWDENRGNGTDHSIPVPVHLPAGARITAISGGLDFGLALTSHGSVLAWGDNAFGQLGNGTTTSTTTPVPVDLPAGTRVTAVSAGYDHGLALTSDGSVLAWGDNFVGQLGDDTTTDSSTPVPVDLPAGTRVTAIAAGQQFSLALTSDGSVLAWGNNAFGQLGDGTTTSTTTPVPVDLPAGTRVTAIAAGSYHGVVVAVPASCRHRWSQGHRCRRPSVQ
jgi:alpha-tubulin suppressor-like RCC1 family protein